ncbi:hypothetical protein AAFF_G00300920 [Aldrovandia affinis]|uniref:Uncharacterized protein n=1 Tax=Aldrovandia affinis TaxID=143900 RepID=A0AAD7SQQ1_9TELE|nr:hypothetical protein AAFF_G00300920 [Aldrovandia affinis]
MELCNLSWEIIALDAAYLAVQHGADVAGSARLWARGLGTSSSKRPEPGAEPACTALTTDPPVILRRAETDPSAVAEGDGGDEEERGFPLSHFGQRTADTVRSRERLPVLSLLLRGVGRAEARDLRPPATHQGPGACHPLWCGWHLMFRPTFGLQTLQRLSRAAHSGPACADEVPFPRHPPLPVRLMPPLPPPSINSVTLSLAERMKAHFVSLKHGSEASGLLRPGVYDGCGQIQGRCAGTICGASARQADWNARRAGGGNDTVYRGMIFEEGPGVPIALEGQACLHSGDVDGHAGEAPCARYISPAFWLWLWLWVLLFVHTVHSHAKGQGPRCRKALPTMFSATGPPRPASYHLITPDN